MLKQQNFPEQAETAATSTEYKEITYHGACYGQPCFILGKIGKEDAQIGRCSEVNVDIMTELAKRQKLCDYKQTAYVQANRKQNLPHGNKTDQKHNHNKNHKKPKHKTQLKGGKKN